MAAASPLVSTVQIQVLSSRVCHLEPDDDDGNDDDGDYNNSGASFLQGWSFSCLMFTTLRSQLVSLLAPSLTATSTESCRGGCWESASPSQDTSDVNTSCQTQFLNWSELVCSHRLNFSVKLLVHTYQSKTGLEWCSVVMVTLGSEMV